MKTPLPLIFVFLISCIGTDVLDDPIIGQSIQIEQNSLELLVGQSEMLDIIYKDKYGIEREIIPLWNSTNENIASLNSQGIITGISAGQSSAIASFNGINSDSVMITVVENEFSVARVEINNSDINEIAIGDSLQLVANAFNINNERIDSASFIWSIDNNGVGIIDQNGLLKGVSDGTVKITASSSGVESLPLNMNIGMNSSNTITTNFMGMNGYTAEGTAVLSTNANNEIILTLQSDFKASFALGTFIYLANSTSGSVVRGSGLELGEISTNGMKTFNVSNISPSVNLQTYRYIIVLCKPASITFGVADLQN